MRSFPRPKIVVFTAAATVFIVVFYLLWAEAPMSYSKSQGGASRHGPDTLFESMGIIPMPSITPPVDIDLKDLRGQGIRLADLKGKIIFLNFWTTWCPDCRAEMPSMERLHRRFKDRRFSMVAVNLRESAETVKTYVEKHGLTFANLLDSDGGTAQGFGVPAIPSTFIINEKGALIGKVFGPRDWDSKKSFQLFEKLIDVAAAGEDPAPWIGSDPK